MFEPACLPILIGSLPLIDHREAMLRVLDCSPRIPLWPQLPKHRREGMLRQFLDGLPALTDSPTRTWIDSAAAGFVEQMTSFYEDVLTHEAPDSPLPDSCRFSLSPDSARGFFILLETLEHLPMKPLAVKGQVTGPITCGIGIRDADGNALFYDGGLRDILTRHLALKARWQIEQLRHRCPGIPTIMFVDEPGMVNFGSTAFPGISRESVDETMSHMIGTIKSSGGLAGLHICANGDWTPALQSDADIISFDAFSYFDNFILYRKPLLDFLGRGGILAWGIVPTGDPEAIGHATTDSLLSLWQQQLEQIAALGIPVSKLLAQTLIAPSCGTGSLTPELAAHVLHLTKELSGRIRQKLL